MRNMQIRIMVLALALLTLAGVACSSQRLAKVESIQPTTGPAQSQPAAPTLRDRYAKQVHEIPMRDGVRLTTIIYLPRDESQRYPIVLFRTPYGIGPYEEDKFRDSLGPSKHFEDDLFIFAYQDVRGAYMSEGTFVDMRPHVEAKNSNSDIDESSDTYDTIAWLLSNIPNHNGRVGQWGISYPGFYAAAGMIDAHPALKAVSPQAPIADWFFDDFHHHGAFFLPHSFNFLASFGRARPEPTAQRHGRFDHGTPDGYQFFLELGSLSNANQLHFKNEIAFWNELAAHPNYDAFWQARNLLPHLKNVAPAVMTVGGWFDAEDLYGPLKIYREIERRNPSAFNILVMGPWGHGGWGRSEGERLGNIDFGGKTSLHYRENIEFEFFRRLLKGAGDVQLAEANVFETGANRWREFERWPPQNLESQALYLNARGALSETAPEEADAFEEFISDPAKPVPFTEDIATGMTREYMTDDQRFATRRPDVLAWQTSELEVDMTLAGPIIADLWVSTSAADADWIVKIIDVHPDDAPNQRNSRRPLAGYQMMVRSEVIRGRFRNSYEHPEPFVPNQPTRVVLELQDVLHRFKKGHRIMVQVQSTWFPLIDRNPQKWVDNIFQAQESDFIKATHRVYRSSAFPSVLRFGTLPPEEPAVEAVHASTR